MAHRKTAPTIIVPDDITQLQQDIEQQMFPGASESTILTIRSSGGTIDEFTEEITYTGSDEAISVSGIVTHVGEHDNLLGFGGEIKVGDLMVTYPYAMISGYLGLNFTSVTLLADGVSGVYLPRGRSIDVVGDKPMFVDIALIPDKNE